MKNLSIYKKGTILTINPVTEKMSTLMCTETGTVFNIHPDGDDSNDVVSLDNQKVGKTIWFRKSSGSARWCMYMSLERHAFYEESNRKEEEILDSFKPKPVEPDYKALYEEALVKIINLTNTLNKIHDVLTLNV